MPRTCPVCRHRGLARERRDAEVADREAVALVEQQVAGLDVAVDDVGGVGGVERRGGLASQRRASRAAIGSPAAQAVGDRAAREVAP